MSIFHLQNHGKRRVAAHKLKLERNMNDFDWQVKFRSFRSFHGNINDWIQPKLKWPQEKLKTMLMQNFGVTKKEHYGIMVFSGPIVIWVCCKLGNPPFHVIYNYQKIFFQFWVMGSLFSSGTNSTDQQQPRWELILLKTIYSWVMKYEIWKIVLGQSIVVERDSVLNSNKIS